MKTIFISIYDGDTEKNILRSGTLDLLKKAGHKIVILPRTGNDNSRLEYYQKNFKSENVVVESLPDAMTKFEYYMYYFSWNTLPTRSAFMKRHDLYLIHRNHLRYAIESMIGFMGRFRWWRNFIRFVYYRIPDDYIHDLYEKYKPDIVFAVNMFSAEDCRLLRTARKRGIRTLTMAKSWDVPTTRGFTRVKADRILVFNEINRKEIIEIGDYDQEVVFPVGFPQFDIYKNKDIYISREKFFNKIGADLNKELVLFAVPGDFKNPYSHEILLELESAIESGRFVKPIQVLARFHPKYPSKGENLKGLKHIILDRPGTYFSKDLERALDAPSTTTFQWTYTDQDIIYLANSLAHSSVVINTESTITLDAAALDRPIVWVGFDGYQKLEYWHSVIRNYSREHLLAALKTDGVLLAKNFDELVDWINLYINNPNNNSEGREKLREKIIYKTDGDSARRIADNILAMIE